MSTEKRYISLPSIKKISVKNYSLFAKDWTYEVKKGLNLFIGANGLGKTTSTYLIIYGIIGDVGESNFIKYFDQRKSFKGGSEDYSSVTVDFTVGKTFYSIERDLEKDSVLKVSIDKTTYEKDEYDNISEIYFKSLTETIGINVISDILFILNKFMIREEEGNYLLWDPMEQSKLIRLLINYTGFEDKYNRLALEVQRFDTLYRGEKDERAQFVKRQKELINKKEEILSENRNYLSKTEIEYEITSLNEEINSLKDKKQRIYEDITYLTNNRKTFDKDIEELSLQIDIISDKITLKEKMFYQNVYSDEKILSAIYKLKTYHICIYCNKNINEEVSSGIINNIENHNLCPVCNTSLNSDKFLVTPSDETVNEISELQKKINELQINLSDKKDGRQKIEDELELIYQGYNLIESQISPIFTKLYSLKQSLAKINLNSEELISEFDFDIKALQKQIDKYDETIKTNKDSYDLALKKLSKVNTELNSTIESFNTKLNNIYYKYASKYFNDNCKLEIHEKKNVKASKVPITTYVPYYNDKLRLDKNDCSTSERLFLEYLFRFSLLELYKELTNNQSFIILETSEGAFDISNTIQLAEAINQFSKRQYPFILISNFSKPDFLNIILSPYNDRNTRVLNFLVFSRLTNQQKNGLVEFNRIIETLKLETI